jgi:hypothetical protein
VVEEVTLFYTVFASLDNKRITVPNGNLMNANIVDYSAKELRRVDLTFRCAKSEKPAQSADPSERCRQPRKGAEGSRAVCPTQRRNRRVDGIYRQSLVQKRGLLGRLF